MIKSKRSGSSVNVPLVSPNRIVSPGSFSAANNSEDLVSRKSVSSFKLRNQMFDQQLKNEVVMASMKQRQHTAEPIVEAPKQGLTLNALKRHNSLSSRASMRRSSGAADPLTSRSSASGNSVKKSAFELEIILVEKQLQLKRLLAEQEKKKKLYSTVAKQLKTKNVENMKTEKFISESLEQSRKSLVALRINK